jgi:uncharacterized protein YbjT (DUF2867 family)
MTTYAIIGGAGTVGRHITAALRDHGNEVRVLSRSSQEHPVDLTTGEGLGSALSGADVVIDAANGDQRRPEPVLVDGTRRLVDAAAAAGVSHLVEVSIIGIERVPVRYYRAKLAQEEIVREGEVPWTIVRSTQFHELVADALAALGRWRLTPRSGALLQPVAAREAAGAIAAVAGGGPGHRSVTVGGPHICRLSDLARTWARSSPCPNTPSADLRHRGATPRSGGASGRGFLVPLPLALPRSLGRPLRDGALTCADPEFEGSTSFARWLAAPNPTPPLTQPV